MAAIPTLNTQIKHVLCHPGQSRQQLEIVQFKLQTKNLDGKECSKCFKSTAAPDMNFQGNQEQRTYLQYVASVE
jgi:hypothetical protein